MTLGEHLQVALNSHDGELYLEQANHIPEEYHKYFGIQPIPIIGSPRSESNTLVTNPEDDENSNSMMSANSEKEGLGAQMVLEQNLGVCGQEDEDEFEDSNSNKKRDRHESSNSKMDSLLNDEESNLSSDSKKSPKNTEEMVTNVTTTVTTVVTANVEEEIQQRTRLPSFSSIIAGNLFFS